MRPLSMLERPRARVAVVAVMISVGVAISMGVGQAAPADPGMANSDTSAPAPATPPAPAEAKGGGDAKDGNNAKKGDPKKADNKGKDGKGKHKDGGKSGKNKPASNMVDGTPCTKTADACVDLVAQKAWLIDVDGKVTRGPVPITSGKPGHETPLGVFNVIYKDIDHRSKEFDNAPMPFAVFFTDGGIAFHEGSLAVPSSGCVHLSHADAVAFFDFLEPGDEVQIH